MAARGEQVCIGLVADADLSANQYQVVRVVSANRVNIASQNSVYRAVGVLQNTPKAAGREATIAVNGETKVMAGAAITAGLPISHNSSGRAIAATSGLAVLGFALEAAGADGDIIRALLLQGPLAQI
jgi:hypothetical protein